MKRANWVRLIAMILVISMLAAPVSAATFGGSGHSTHGLIGAIIGIIKDIIIEIIDDWFDIPGVGDPDPTEPPVPTTPEEPTDPAEPEPSEPAVTDPTVPSEPEQTDPTDPSEPEEEAPEYELNLVEGHANTVNGNLLRGVTYTLSQLVAQEPQTAPYALRSTGYALNAVAEETTTISDTALVITYDENGNAVIEDGQYALGIVGGKYVTNVSAISDGRDTLSGTSSKDSATIWTITRQADGSYTVQDPNNEYLSVPSWKEARMSATPVYLSIHQDGSNTVLKQPKTRDEDRDEYCYLNALDGITSSSFGGWTEGSPICLYAVTTTEPEQPETEYEVVRFPVTMFNYNNGTTELNEDSILRNLTHKAEIEAGFAEKELWEGLYFSGGTPYPTSYSYSTTATAYADLTWQQVMNGTYYADAACTEQVSVVQKGQSDGGYSEVTVTAGELWTNAGGVDADTFYLTSYYHYTSVNGAASEYYPVYIKYYDSTNDYEVAYLVNGEYPMIDAGANHFPTADETVSLYAKAGITGYTLTAGGNTLATLEGTDLTAKVGIPLYSGGRVEVTKAYAAWNWWSYKPDNNNSDNAQNKFYAGLVQDELVNGEIKFNVVEPGIFTFDPDHPEITKDEVKDIYQNVGLPFVKNEKGYYTFDSDAHGTYFSDTTGDGKSDPGYGASDKYFDMYFDYQNTQGWADKSDPNSNLGYGDGSSNLWAPYNTNANDTDAGAIDYHFGMRADIPFSMTSNGRIKSTDDNSDPITFEFHGDDDVWIFIDGHLVIDLGGIHNRLGAKINFAENTITYSLPDSNKNTNPFGAFNIEGFELVQKLYDDASGEGALGQTRFDFSAEEEHKMTIFYLERGKGTSNCKIEFNLPMRDTLMVTKDASMSWSEKQDEADKENGDGTAPLTSSEQAAVNNIPFGFTLYKKEANATVFTPVANTNYFLQDQKGVVKDTLSTDANGHFYLKNGETAKFMTDFPKEGVTYYVVEDKTPKGFLTPDFQFKGKATNGFDWYNEKVDKWEHITDASVIDEQEIPMDWTGENKSYTITAYGSVEAIDSLEFICVNYMNAELPNPSALAMEDIIVIDYGLPVQIDPLHNDVFRGDSIEIVHYTVGDVNFTDAEGKISKEKGDDLVDDEKDLTGDFGNFEFHNLDYRATFNEKGEITNVDRDTFSYALNKQLTKVEVLTYVVKVTGSKIQDATGITKTDYCYAQAKLYIVPATIMYYEENFNDLVHFEFLNGATAPKFEKEDAYISDYQEPGVVGDRNDSTYGSDVAYLGDPHDSNGTSFFFDTTNGAVRFWYTFTGTGTSFFARTSATTGYMQVLLFAGDQRGSAGQQLNTYYRDTYFCRDADKPLEEKTDYLMTHDENPLYNIPVYTVDELPYGTYTVLVTVAKKGTKSAGPMHPEEDGTYMKRSMHEFYLDGIRVMQPLDGVYVNRKDMEPGEDGTISELIPIPDEDRTDITNKALDAYNTDNESNLDIVTLRNKLIDENYFPVDPESGEVEEAWPFVVLTDTNGEVIYASDYVSIGPKEEVYLAPGQKVTFSLKYWEPEGLWLYIGMKAPFGSGASLKVGNTPYTIGNATDCYYDVTKSYASLTQVNEDGETYYVVTYTFEVPADATEVVSLTNIKVVGSHKFTLVYDQNEDTEVEVNE